MGQGRPLGYVSVTKGGPQELRELITLAGDDLKGEAAKLGQQLPVAIWLRTVHWLARSYDLGRSSQRKTHKPGS